MNFTLELKKFNYAIMEKAKNVFFVAADFYWDDVGSFTSVGEIIKDKNVVMGGKLIELNSTGNVISAAGVRKTIALIDCNDLLVIDTQDALLVCPKSSSEKIKKLVEEKVAKELQ